MFMPARDSTFPLFHIVDEGHMIVVIWALLRIYFFSLQNLYTAFFYESMRIFGFLCCYNMIRYLYLIRCFGV